MLAPCALEQVITGDNADQIRAKIICEGANGPATPAADEILDERGILVLPDVLANAGGVVVSYFEWVQGLQEYFWKETEVNAKLNDIVTRAFNETWRATDERGASMRMAAYGLAVQRVAEATDHARPLPVAPPRVTLYHAQGCHLCERARRGRRRGAGETARSSSRRWTSPATPSSRRATASGCPWSRSRASAPSSTTSTLVRFVAKCRHKLRLA